MGNTDQLLIYFRKLERSGTGYRDRGTGDEILELIDTGAEDAEDYSEPRPCLRWDGKYLITTQTEANLVHDMSTKLTA